MTPGSRTVQRRGIILHLCGYRHAHVLPGQLSPGAPGCEMGRTTWSDGRCLQRAQPLCCAPRHWRSFTVTLRIAGAPMGSVGALSSVKITTAALLGHFLLGEALGRLHMLALLLAVGGAVLIWDPETIRASDPRVLGNTLALLSGISAACGTVCARKAGKVSSLMLGPHRFIRWLAD